MKRRVLNAAANKKALRQCSAMTNARAPFRVICDSSFLRVAFDYYRHYKKAAESLHSHKELEATLPSLETLFAELFGTPQYYLQTIIESQDEFQKTYAHSHSNTGAAKKAQKQLEEEKKLLEGGKNAAAVSGSLSSSPKDLKQNNKTPQHQPNPKLVSDAQQFLRKFELIGSPMVRKTDENDTVSAAKKEAASGKKVGTEDELAEANKQQQREVGNKQQRRNEQKAIMTTLLEIATASSSKQQQGGAAAHNNLDHPLSSYFVATLNHDMKALLKGGLKRRVASSSSDNSSNTSVMISPTSVPTIRMTFNPWLLWIEAGEVITSASSAAASAIGAPVAMTPSAAADSVAFKNVTNKADRAFLEHLKKESSTLAATVSARDKFLSSGYDKKKIQLLRQQQQQQQQSSAKGKPLSSLSTPASAAGTNNVAGRNIKKNSSVVAVNPLAMKKKRQRERIVSEEVETSEGNKTKQSRSEK